MTLTISQFDQGLELPANVGCDLQITGSYTELIGVFTLQPPTAVPDVQVVGTQTATYQSYIGVGEVGRFRPLMDQMQALYPERHTYIEMSIPPDANYIFAVYQPMPGDYPGMPYDADDPNRSLPSCRIACCSSRSCTEAPIRSRLRSQTQDRGSSTFERWGRQIRRSRSRLNPRTVSNHVNLRRSA